MDRLTAYAAPRVPSFLVRLSELQLPILVTAPKVCLALLAQCSLLISIFPLQAVCAARGVPGYGTMLIPPTRSV